MRWNVGTKIGVAFGVVLIIFVVVGVVSFRSTSRLLEAAALRKQTYETLIALGKVPALLGDIEGGQRGYVITGEDGYLEPYQTALSRIDPVLLEIRQSTVANPQQQRQMNALEPLVRNRLAVAKAIVDARRTKSEATAMQMIADGEGKALSERIRSILTEFEREENALLAQHVQATEAEGVMTQWTIALGTLSGLMLAALAWLTLTRHIAGPLRELTTVAERITVGDLSVDVSRTTRSDEVGVLARAFDRMTQSLRSMAGAAEKIAAGDLESSVTPQSPHDVLGNAFARMVENLRGQIRQLVEGAAVLGAAASEIVASTTQLASSASQSAAAVSETTTTVEEVRQTAEVSSRKAQQVSDSAQKAALVSQNGRKSTEDVAAGMQRIRQQMEAITAGMERLSERSQAIGQIVATVEDLATQSNLLAVNAAIEAAKAGEHGRGFGVVAQEVRSLAAQSRQATNDVRTILGEIQKATTTAVLAAEQGGKAVDAGARQTEAAGEAILALSGSVTEAAQAAIQIAASSQQQLVGVDQVAAAMESIKQGSTQNVASARQLESAARNLKELGERVTGIVGRYKI